ncbi:MAG: hypothetical protein HY901_20520 [Deltaproteobacteria bacterium]|nr:hypothetical protein [Deltaproteobacteria bacterium]
MAATRCEDVVARLTGPHAREDEEVRAHLEACASCRSLAETMRALEQTAQSPSPERLGHFATRVRAAHLRRQDERQRKAPLRTGLLAGAFTTAAAAAVVLALELAFPRPSPLAAGSASAELAVSSEPAPAPMEIEATREEDEELWAAELGDEPDPDAAEPDDDELAFLNDEDELNEAI